MRKTLGMLMAAGILVFAPSGAAFAEMSIEAALGEEEATVMIIEVEEAPVASEADPYAIEFETGAEAVAPAEQGSADDASAPAAEETAAPAAEEAPAVDDGKPAG